MLPSNGCVYCLYRRATKIIVRLFPCKFIYIYIYNSSDSSVIFMRCDYALEIHSANSRELKDEMPNMHENAVYVLLFGTKEG